MAGLAPAIQPSRASRTRQTCVTLIPTHAKSLAMAHFKPEFAARTEWGNFLRTAALKFQFE
jgi:hypothetical protein